MKKSTAVLVSLLGLVLFMLYHAVVLHRLGWNWEISITDSLISNLTLGTILIGLILIFSHYQPEKTNRYFRLLLGLGISIIYIYSVEYLLNSEMKQVSGYTDFVTQSLPIRLFIAFLILAFTLVCVWIWTSQQDRQEMEKRKSEAEILKNEAELVQLRQQLQPHFLFNSLNSISALIGSQPLAARKMTQQLSDFLRGTLKKESETIRLEEELDHLRLYLEIEKVRFGQRLDVQIKVSPDCQNSMIPALLLQPLVENAIKFGLYGTLESVSIQLFVEKLEGHLLIRITNPYEPISKSQPAGTGFGLYWLQRRLQLLYNRNDLLLTLKSENTFTTELRIPN